MKEGKCIHDHLRSTIKSVSKSNNVARKFGQLISLSKITAALKLISTDAKGILPLNSKIPCGQNGNGDTVWKSVIRNILAEKHPAACAAVTYSLLASDSYDAPCYDPVLFDQLTSDLIRCPALYTHSATGPSGVDAYAW